MLATNLRKIDGIMTRLEGKRIFIYYFKPKVLNDTTELSEDIKIQSKVSYTR